MKVKSRLVLLYVLILVFVQSFSLYTIAEDEEKDAIRLTSSLQLKASGHDFIFKQITDSSLDRAVEFYPYERFYVSWNKPKAAPGYLCIQWDSEPVNVQLWQVGPNDEILSKRDVPQEYDTIEKLLPGTKEIAFVAGREGMSIMRLALYSDGKLPEPFINWLSTPDHLDYLIVATHPDDDVLFMGGIIPIYGAERGHIGTVAYVTSPNRTRIQEAMLGAWAMGTPYRPLFLGFQDIGAGDMNKQLYQYRFMPEAVTLALVRLFRDYRPLVVFTHDVNGEYGHWQHKVVSACVVDASRLAGDESYDPVSVSKNGTWQVQKCYLHIYPSNQLVMDVNSPLSSMGGRTALQVAKDSFSKHVSQQTGRHWVQSDFDKHPLSHFGMAYGIVEPGKDVFDNIDPKLFASNVLMGTEQLNDT